MLSVRILTTNDLFASIHPQHRADFARKLAKTVARYFPDVSFANVEVRWTPYAEDLHAVAVTVEVLYSSGPGRLNLQEEEKDELVNAILEALLSARIFAESGRFAAWIRPQPGATFQARIRTTK